MVDTNGAPGSLGDGSNALTAAMDPSDLTWLNFDSMDLINDQELHEKCTRVVTLLKELKLDLGKLVWAVNFGNEAPREVREMRDARAQFRGSYLIPTLQNMRTPPRTRLKGKAPQNAREKIDGYVHALVGQQFREEMRTFEKTYGGLTSNELSEQKLQDINLEKLEEKARSSAPGLFTCFSTLGYHFMITGHIKSNIITVLVGELSPIP
ncbi:hypothetical protein FRC11_006357 [Ceratobasidium sp. 423]|nr:hypothetical protein FRC11_006357 [Ceratobasidium sp. 423]